MSRKGPELCIGLVGAVGTDLNLISDHLKAVLSEFEYDVDIIRLSHEIKIVQRSRGPLPPLVFEDKRIEYLQQAGNDFRRKIGEAARAKGKTPHQIGQSAVAVLGLRRILKTRARINTKAGISKADADNLKLVPAHRVAYVISSLKRPEEVHLLRAVYGPQFVLLAAYRPKELRIHRLAKQIAISHNSVRSDDYRSEAMQLVKTDESEPDDDYGQDVGDAFPLADAFIRIDPAAELHGQIARFVDVYFGHPFCTPTREEFGMFLAKASALRSSDLSRQVGATISTHDGDVIAVGTNEVPCADGGMYWPGDRGDTRDFQTRQNQSLEMRQSTLAEVLARLDTIGALVKDQLADAGGIREMVRRIWRDMKDTRLGEIGEFGRTVHAEMAALLDAARRGVPVKGGTLYTTTFPCHNCTRHIIGAGLSRVIYIEPYPKSLAEELHRDAIVVDSPHWVQGKVNFQPFVGLSSRLYVEFFQKSKAERQAEGRVADFDRKTATPLFWRKEWGPALYPSTEFWLYGILQGLMRGRS